MVLDRTVLEELEPVPATLPWLEATMLVGATAGMVDDEPETDVVEEATATSLGVVVVTLEELVATSASDLEFESELAQLLINTAASTVATNFIAKILPIYSARVDLRAYVHRQKCKVTVDTFAGNFNADSDFILFIVG